MAPSVNRDRGRTDVATFEDPPDPPDFLPGQVVVRVAQDAVWEHVEVGGRLPFTRDVAGSLPASVTEPLDFLRTTAGLRDLAPVLSSRRAELGRVSLQKRDRQRLAVASSVTDVELPRFAGISMGVMTRTKATPELLRHVNQSPGLEVSLVPARWLTAAAPVVDPERNLQWGLRAIEWFGAAVPDASDVTVAVIDSGVDASHPALAGLDLSYDHTGRSKPDVIGHGTHIVGTIAAAADNDTGIAGMTAPRLRVWKVMNDEPASDGYFYVDGERYVRSLFEAALAKPAVVNLSLAGHAPSHEFEGSVIETLRDSGAVVVASMGNGGRGTPAKASRTMYPAGHDGVLAVGSVAEDGMRSDFSSTGPHIDLVAPGSNILSLQPVRASKHRSTRGLGVESGTSMAAAHVSAAVALLAAKHPDWSGNDLVECVRSTARRLPAMRRAKAGSYGSGLLNLRAALSSEG